MVTDGLHVLEHSASEHLHECIQQDRVELCSAAFQELALYH